MNDSSRPSESDEIADEPAPSDGSGQHSESPAGDEGREQTHPAPGGFRAGPFVIIAILVCIFALIQVQRKLHNRDAREEAQLQEAIKDGNVPLTIELDPSQPEITVMIPWYPGITVRDLMIEAQQEGVIEFEESGVGDDAMLISIKGTKNEGGGSDDRNWLFRVNGKLADRSFAIYELKKGDVVSWQFDTYENSANQ